MTESDGGPAGQGLPGPAPQAFGVVGGMAAWGVALLTAYPMVRVACATGAPTLVHLVRWVALAVAVAATLTASWVYRRAAHADEEHLAPKRLSRMRMVGFGGALVSASGALLLIVEDLATWVIDPCI